MSDLPPPEVLAVLVGTPCAIIGSAASGVYDDKGNCIVPYQFARPDGPVHWKTIKPGYTGQVLIERNGQYEWVDPAAEANQERKSGDGQ